MSKCRKCGKSDHLTSKDPACPKNPKNIEVARQKDKAAKKKAALKKKKKKKKQRKPHARSNS